MYCVWLCCMLRVFFVLYVVGIISCTHHFSSLIKKSKTESNCQPGNRVVDVQQLQPDFLIGYYSQFWLFGRVATMTRAVYTAKYSPQHTHKQHGNIRYMQHIQLIQYFQYNLTTHIQHDTHQHSYGTQNHIQPYNTHQHIQHHMLPHTTQHTTYDTQHPTYSIQQHTFNTYNHTQQTYNHTHTNIQQTYDGYTTNIQQTYTTSNTHTRTQHFRHIQYIQHITHIQHTYNTHTTHIQHTYDTHTTYRSNCAELVCGWAGLWVRKNCFHRSSWMKRVE